MIKFTRALLIATVFLSMTAAHAALSPVSVAIFPGLEFPPEEFTISGVRVSALWGEHRQVYGIDLGAVGNITEQSFAGIGISGIFNITEGTTTIVGLQAAGITNINTNKTHVVGVQLAGLVNSNTAESVVAGIQLAPIANLSSHTDICGLQVGLFNEALNVYGLQIGLINKTETLHGLQIGLVNLHEKGLFVVSPVLNMGF